jgi:hypothetical protein
MAKTVEEQITVLEKKIPEVETRLEKVKTWALSDGDLSSTDQKAIEKIEKSLADLRKKKVTLNAERGVMDFSDSPIEVKSELKPYDHSSFKTTFKQSIDNWCQDKAIKLNSVRTYMIERKEPAGLEVKDIVSVVGLIWPPAKHIGTAIDLAQIAEKAMNSYLKASQGKTPSLNEIHSAWSESLDQLNSNSEKAFPKFVEYYKKENDIPADNDQAVVELFNTACADFAKTHMPSGKDVQKAFVQKVLSTVKDGMDVDDGKVGFADMTMVRVSDHFGSPEGQLDDVPNDLLQAIQTVHRGSKVIDLPVEIKVTVKTHMGAYKTVIERKSKSPGNTSFKKTSGEDDMYEAFMKGKFYNSLMVSNLKVDS